MNCCNCNKLFLERDDGKGYKRYACYAELLPNHLKLLPYHKKTFLCPTCHRLYQNMKKYKDAEQLFYKATDKAGCIGKRLINHQKVKDAGQRKQVISLTKTH